MKIAILGAGEMGEWFAKLGKDIGWDVKITDIDGEKARAVAEKLDVSFSENNESAVKDSEVVLISVPVKETPKVIEEVSEYAQKDSLILDVASIKEKPVEMMRKIEIESELVSIHPLFGPGAKDLSGKNIILLPVKPGEKYRNFKKILSKRGARVEEMEAIKHDRFMSVIQSLTHFTLLSYLSALNSIEYSEEAKKFGTPMSKKLLKLSKAFLRENAELCGDIQIKNNYSSDARKSLIEAGQSIDSALNSENIKILQDIFDEARNKLDSDEIESAYREIYEELGEEK